MMTPLPILSCDNCGACCSTQGTPPFTRIGSDKPPPELEWDILEHTFRYDESKPCLWFDEATKRCRHYEHRPRACREAVVPGDEYCQSFREEQGIGEVSNAREN